MSGNINGPIKGNNHFFSVKPKIIPEAWSSNSYSSSQEKERNPSLIMYQGRIKKPKLPISIQPTTSFLINYYLGKFDTSLSHLPNSLALMSLFPYFSKSYSINLISDNTGASGSPFALVFAGTCSD